MKLLSVQNDDRDTVKKDSTHTNDGTQGNATNEIVKLLIAAVKTGPQEMDSMGSLIRVLMKEPRAIDATSPCG